MKMIVQARVDGRYCGCLLYDGPEATYGPVPGLTWYDKDVAVRVLIGHAPLRWVDGGQLVGLRAVHLMGLRGHERLPSSWVLLWNGDVGARRAQFVVESLQVTNDEGTSSPTDPLPRRLVDGTFLGVCTGWDLTPHPVGTAQLLADAGLTANPPAKVQEALQSAATRLQPWVDDEVDVGAQASPGSVRLVRPEILLLATTPSWGADLPIVLRNNALQDGRRRLHYFQVLADGGLACVRPAQLGGVITEAHGLVLGADKPLGDPGDVLVNGSWLPIKRAAEEQHFFRLANHADAFAVTGDPLFWLVGHGLLQYAVGSKMGKAVPDTDGNQRRAWVPFSAARWARRLAPCDAASGGKGTWKLDCSLIAAAWLGKMAVLHGEAITASGNIRFLSENLNPSRGHHGATLIAYQVAVQFLAADEILLGLVEGALPEIVVPPGWCLTRADATGTRQQAFWCVLDLIRLREYTAPRDKGPWGPGLGSPAYDVATRVTPQLEIGAAAGDWWHSGTGSGANSTYLWSFEALLRGLQRPQLGGWQLGGTEGVTAAAADFHQRSDPLRLVDKGFPELVGTATLADSIGLRIRD